MKTDITMHDINTMECPDSDLILPFELKSLTYTISLVNTLIANILIDSRSDSHFSFDFNKTGVFAVFALGVGVGGGFGVIVFGVAISVFGGAGAASSSSSSSSSPSLFTKSL